MTSVPRPCGAVAAAMQSPAETQASARRSEGSERRSGIRCGGPQAPACSVTLNTGAEAVPLPGGMYATVQSCGAGQESPT